MKDYSPTDTGKMAHYMIRWRMRDGSVSAWGETVSATINEVGLNKKLKKAASQPPYRL